MIIIKLGGSIITDKTDYRKFNKDVVARLCKEIKESGQKVIIVHGAGSFGHIISKRFKLNEGYVDKAQIPAVAQVCYDTRDLSSMIIKELIDAGIPAISVPPGSAFYMEDRILRIEDESVIKMMVEKGLMPVMFGDVVQDKNLGFAICSGDQITELLAKMFDAERVIFVSDIDGLFDSDPKTDPNAELLSKIDKDTLSAVNTDISVDDVTGGVRGKIETMLDMCSKERDCILVNGMVEGRLLSLLKGDDVICTRAEGE